MKYYAFMPFRHWSEIMDERPTNGDYILGNVVRTTDSLLALTLYAETPCPASQLIIAIDEEELKAKIQVMIQNFKNPKWVAKLEEFL